MELLIAMALAYALGGGITAGRATAAQHTKTPKDPKPIDRTESGRKVAQGAINSVARVYTWTSGAREGWRKAWPETKSTIQERRATVKASKAERKTAREKTGPARDARVVDDGIVDAEIVEDEVVNTGGPKAPTTEKVAEAKEAAEAAADATPGPPVPPRPDHPPTVPAPGDGSNTTGSRPVPPPRTAPAGTAPPGAPPRAADPDSGPHLRVVKDRTSQPVAAGGGKDSTPRSSMSNLPTTATLVTEVTGVDSLMKYLAQLSRWARMEKDDATAAVMRLTDLRAKAEHAYNAAAAAKYDKATLGELAAIVEKLTELKTAREEDLRASDLAERNAGQSSANVWARHGGIQEARNQSSVDMAETTTYGD
ncbi:hypothetical protein [Kitasatospora sp. MBT63]|uniref:hypothetical protein n=1 Tax=Kitasatospora sp. MBT63 TaxID=1444768 RepID=UPI00053B2D6D|nr:hypothetical protein [Kitasatospora sp. MBT63]